MGGGLQVARVQGWLRGPFERWNFHADAPAAGCPSPPTARRLTSASAAAETYIERASHVGLTKNLPKIVSLVRQVAERELERGAPASGGRPRSRR